MSTAWPGAWLHSCGPGTAGGRRPINTKRHQCWGGQEEEACFNIEEGALDWPWHHRHFKEWCVQFAQQGWESALRGTDMMVWRANQGGHFAITEAAMEAGKSGLCRERSNCWLHSSAIIASRGSRPDGCLTSSPSRAKSCLHSLSSDSHPQAVSGVFAAHQVCAPDPTNISLTLSRNVKISGGKCYFAQYKLITIFESNN